MSAILQEVKLPGGARRGGRAVVKVGEFEVDSARNDGFGDVGLGDQDAQAIVDSTEADVEEIVGGLIKWGLTLLCMESIRGKTGFHYT